YLGGANILSGPIRYGTGIYFIYGNGCNGTDLGTGFPVEHEGGQSAISTCSIRKSGLVHDKDFRIGIGNGGPGSVYILFPFTSPVLGNVGAGNTDILYVVDGTDLLVYPCSSR